INLPHGLFSPSLPATQAVLRSRSLVSLYLVSRERRQNCDPLTWRIDAIALAFSAPRTDHFRSATLPCHATCLLAGLLEMAWKISRRKYRCPSARPSPHRSWLLSSDSARSARFTWQTLRRTQRPWPRIHLC